MEKFLNERKFSLKRKRIYRSYVRSAMLYGRVTLCLRENEMAILKRNQKVITRAMCGVELIEKRSRQEHKKMLGL